MISGVILASFALVTMGFFVGTGVARGGRDKAVNTTPNPVPTSHFYFRPDAR